MLARNNRHLVKRVYFFNNSKRHREHLKQEIKDVFKALCPQAEFIDKDVKHGKLEEVLEEVLKKDKRPKHTKVALVVKEPSVDEYYALEEVFARVWIIDQIIKELFEIPKNITIPVERMSVQWFLNDVGKHFEDVFKFVIKHSHFNRFVIIPRDLSLLYYAISMSNFNSLRPGKKNWLLTKTLVEAIERCGGMAFDPQTLRDHDLIQPYTPYRQWVTASLLQNIEQRFGGKAVFVYAKTQDNEQLFEKLQQHCLPLPFNDTLKSLVTVHKARVYGTKEERKEKLKQYFDDQMYWEVEEQRPYRSGPFFF